MNIVPKYNAGERMFFDGSKTKDPDDGTFYRAQGEMHKNYSLDFAVLMEIIVFLKRAEGNVAVL